MNKYSIYQVGGSIRNEYLGYDINDYDFVFVINNLSANHTRESAYEEMINYLRDREFYIFHEIPHSFTAKIKFPPNYGKYSNINADIVLARTDSYDNKRTPTVNPCNLYYDLQRRDFTINAIARNIYTDEIVDFFGGVDDINNKVLRCMRDPKIVFMEDPIRILRCIRFATCLNLSIDIKILNVMTNIDVINNLNNKLNKEQIFFQLNKIARCNNLAFKQMLFDIHKLSHKLFEALFKHVNLVPTLKDIENKN